MHRLSGTFAGSVLGAGAMRDDWDGVNWISINAQDTTETFDAITEGGMSISVRMEDGTFTVEDSSELDPCGGQWRISGDTLRTEFWDGDGIEDSTIRQIRWQRR